MFSNDDFLIPENINKSIEFLECNNDFVLSTGKYNSDNDHMSRKKTKKFKYTCIHSTPQKGIVYFYSTIKFNKTPKIIFGDSGLGKAFVNKKGKYCLTEHAIGIVDKDTRLDKILRVLKSDKMKEIFKACLWSNFQIDWRMFRDFKKNFYKLI